MPYTPRATNGVCGWLVNVVCWKNRWPRDESGARGSNSNPTTISHTLHISHAFWVRRKSTGSQRCENLLHSEVRFDIRWWAALQLV